MRHFEDGRNPLTRLNFVSGVRKIDRVGRHPRSFGLAFFLGLCFGAAALFQGQALWALPLFVFPIALTFAFAPVGAALRRWRSRT